MANIDTIIAFSQGKQRFGFMKNDYFLVSGHMYYKGMEWPVAAWDSSEDNTFGVHPGRFAHINTQRRGNDHSIGTYVLNELNRLGVKTKTATLLEIRSVIDG